MYNATWLSAPQRLATRLRVLRRAATQLNDLFVNLLSRLGSTRRNSACLIAPQFNATICLLQRLSTRLGFSQGTTAPRRAPRINSTQRFVYYIATCCYATPLRTPHCSSVQLNDLFITSRRNVAYSIAALLGSTQRFVCDVAPFRSASPRRATQRTSSQRNDLFITSYRPATQLSATLHAFRQRSSPQCNSTICLSIYRRCAAQRSATTRNLSLRPRIAAPRLTRQFNATQRNELKLN